MVSETKTSFRAERQALLVLFDSGCLDRDSNSGRLLEYLCQKRFDGTESDVKEANIAIDVFGRTTEFDRRKDSIVRVEASRLRKRLDEYYAHDGSAQPLRIVIPAGQYVPQFIDNAPPEPKPSRWPALKPQHRLWLLASMFALIAVWAGIYIVRSRNPKAGVPIRSGTTPPTTGIRILCGYESPSYTDRQGRIWLGDRYFSGGDAYRPEPRYIARTSEPTLLQTMRTGSHFSYNIPLKPGICELRLHFMEHAFGPSMNGGGGEISRLMTIKANGKLLMPEFDPYTDAGGDHIADVRVFKDIVPGADGFLHLAFDGIFDTAFVNAIEIDPGIQGKIRPIRIVARDTSYTDHSGQVWSADRFVMGGKLVLRTEYIKGSGDADLYLGERFGRFDYAIPVPPGKYAVTLRFSEQWFKDGGSGKRLFDVYANGVALLHDFDLYREAGGALRPFDRTFHGIEPNAQGKINLSFMPVVNYATINAIEVIDESNGEVTR